MLQPHFRASYGKEDEGRTGVDGVVKGTELHPGGKEDGNEEAPCLGEGRGAREEKEGSIEMKRSGDRDKRGLLCKKTEWLQ